MNRSVVCTKSWVVELMLDLLGYLPGRDLVHKVIVEPACGTGAFLRPVVRRLAEDLHGQGLSWPALEASVRAWEISGASAAGAIATVTASLQEQGCPKAQADRLARTWIRNGDFLLSEKSQCTWVVGNPPYVRAADIDPGTRKRYMEALAAEAPCSFTRGCDLYVAFLEKGLDMLEPGGTLCFICPDRWLHNAYGRRLRKRISLHFTLSLIVQMHEADAFEKKVGAYPAITVIRKAAPASGRVCYAVCTGKPGAADVQALLGRQGTGTLPLHELERPVGDEGYVLGDPEQLSFLARTARQLPTLEEAGVTSGIGLATGCDAVFIVDERIGIEPSRLLPFLVRGAPGQPGQGLTRRKWLVNPWNEDGTLVDLEQFPLLRDYLLAHEGRLQNRYIAKRNRTAWYRTIDKPNPDLLDRDLLVLPDLARAPEPVLTRGCYPHHNFSWMYSDQWDLQALGGLLLSDTIRTAMEAQCVKMRGGTLRVQVQSLRRLHIPRYESVSRDVLQGLAQAFVLRDRTMASRYTDRAYREAMRS